MLFVTNRIPKESPESKEGRSISFSLQNTAASQDVYFCERKDDGQYIEVMNTTFFKELKSLPKETQILLYIHGFNNTGEREVFPNAKALQEIMNSELGPKAVYVVPLIWPCDDDSAAAFIDDYWDDQDAADASGLAFARVMGKFDDWRKGDAKSNEPCKHRINVLAHSMGNRVLENSLNTWVKKFSIGGMPQIFRNVFMFAADVKNQSLEKGKKGQYICDSARNVVVYYANDDLAMPSSKLANLKNKTVSRRLGMTGPESMKKLPKFVYEVDCDDINSTFGGLTGHTYFLYDNNANVSPAAKHMAKAISTGRVEPNNRSVILAKP